MADVRTYTTTGPTPATCTPTLSRVDAERIRVRWDSDRDGKAVTTQVLTNQAARSLAAKLEAIAPVEAPTTPPEPLPGDTQAPTPPVLTGTAGDASARLSWTPATDDNAVTEYEVWHGSTYVTGLPPTTLSYTVTGLANGTTYNFRVVAYDKARNPANSNVVVLIPKTATTPTPTPTPPAPTPPSSIQPTLTNLVLEDTFDSGVIDPAKWSLYDGKGHESSNGIGGIRDPKCWSIRKDIPGVDGGCLVGTARWDATHTRTVFSDGTVLSGPTMRTPGLSSLVRGLTTFRIEVRARVEPDPTGITAANMLMTWADDGVSGEFNGWETTGTGNGSRYPMKTFDHYVTAGGLPQLPFEHSYSGADWHTLTHERTASWKRVWVDGVLVVDITDPAYLKLNSKPHHLTLQLDALRNADPGRDIHMFVDAVRIWKP